MVGRGVSLGVSDRAICSCCCCSTTAPLRPTAKDSLDNQLAGLSPYKWRLGTVHDVAASHASTSQAWSQGPHRFLCTPPSMRMLARARARERFGLAERPRPMVQPMARPMVSTAHEREPVAAD
eukprot:scaffold125265_cov69-Phaeocystis_antarctica.AAC.3